jgi:ABC-2 type transport system permease protein
MATSTISDQELHLVAPRQPVAAHLRDIWKFRELLRNLVRKELKVKYKKSFLGFLWSMINPLFLLAVYSFVFNILGTAFDYFTIWLLIGILAWNLFNSSVLAGTASVSGNAYLVNKVRFPREVLPLASVGAALVHFFLQSIVLVIVLAAVRYNVDWSYVWLLPFALVTLLVFAAALAVIFSAMNVYLRDTGHLLELAMMAWFWLSPILYPYMLVAQKLVERGLSGNLLLLNPITAPLITFQRALYGKAEIVKTAIDPKTGKTVVTGVTRLLPDGSPLWYLRNVGIVFAVSLLLFLLAIKIFDRAEGNFAEVM